MQEKESTYNGYSVRIENSKPRDAEQLPSWRNFQFAHNSH